LFDEHAALARGLGAPTDAEVARGLFSRLQGSCACRAATRRARGSGGQG
jgi:hypothetical protein